MRQHLVNVLKVAFVVALGIGIYMLMNASPKVAERLPDALPAKTVRTVSVAEEPFVVKVRAYGSIEPALEFESRSELSAKVSYVHPELNEGGSISANTIVVRLDAEDFESSLSQTESDLSSRQSDLSRIEREEASTRASLALAKETLILGEAELARVRSLLDKQLIASSKFDAEEQKVLQLRQSVSDLEGKLSTFASQRASAGAQINRSSQQVESRKTTLGRTEVIIPFDARISRVNISEGEFVSVGTSLFEAINIDGVEVRADLPVRVMGGLLSAFKGQSFDLATGDITEALRSLKLKAEVRLADAGQNAVWDGRVVRVSEAIDPQKRTVGLTVAVDNPYENVIIGSKPPLIKGMYVSVDISAPPFDAMTLPRNAIHQNRVYLANAVNELEIRPIQIKTVQGNRIVIDGGLTVGERVIVDDLIPVIEGMPLNVLGAE